MQYGLSVSAFAVYMTQYQLLPYQRTAEVLNELAGFGISDLTGHPPTRRTGGRYLPRGTSQRDSPRTRRCARAHDHPVEKTRI